jgi:hypothetical protein
MVLNDGVSYQIMCVDSNFLVVSQDDTVQDYFDPEEKLRDADVFMHLLNLEQMIKFFQWLSQEAP